MLGIPKFRMAVVLSLISLFSTARFFSFDLVLRLVIITSAVMIFEYLFWKVRKIEPFLPIASIVTALIIFLLAEVTTSLISLIVACFSSAAVKQFLRPGGNHIVNPAASGLLIGSFLGLPVTWWGVSWGVIPLVATVFLAGFVSLFTIRQHRIVIPFIAVTIWVVVVFLGNLQAALGQLSVGSFWFFALVMLPEPMTAAHFPKTRIFYGVTVAILSFLISKIGLFDPLLASLLLGNLIFRIVEQKFKMR